MSSKTKSRIGLALSVIGLALALYNVYLHMQEHVRGPFVLGWDADGRDPTRPRHRDGLSGER